MRPNQTTLISDNKARLIPLCCRGQGRSCLRACLLALAVGCQAPPTQPAACSQGQSGPPRQVVLVRQLLADTVLETATHPTQFGNSLVTESAADLRALVTAFYYKRIALPLAAGPIELDTARPILDPEALEHELGKVAGNELRPAEIRLLVGGPDALDALHRVIDEAVCRIDVLMYLWDSDPLGEEVARHLAARAGCGLRVRVLVDGGGNLIDGLPKAATAAEVNRVVCWLARQPYVEVLRSRNPVGHFDHRKLVVVDERLAWSGGRNFTGPSFFEYHDLSYTLKGPLAGEMGDIFEDYWKRQGGVPTPALLPVPPTLAPNASARLVRTRPNQRQLAQALYLAVDRARHHVYIENPYLSDPLLLGKLTQARRRGVDVRVVLTVRSGSKAVDGSNRVTANRLLRAGVRVYLYPGLTHAKATTVDGLWAYLGTGNFDALSLRHNRELGVAVGSGPLIADLEEALFVSDFRSEWELTEPLLLTGEDYFYDALATLFL